MTNGTPAGTDHTISLLSTRCQEASDRFHMIVPGRIDVVCYKDRLAGELKLDMYKDGLPVGQTSRHYSEAYARIRFLRHLDVRCRISAARAYCLALSGSDMAPGTGRTPGRAGSQGGSS